MPDDNTPVALANLNLIYVSDIERSVSLYKEVFNINPNFVTSRYIAFPTYESGDALFALWTGGFIANAKVPNIGEIDIMLKTGADVDRKFESLRNHPDLSIVKEPYNDVFGRTFVVKDHDGHLIRASHLN